MIELGLLRSFIAVATELHFGRAARRLNMTQPPLSRQIHLLERELGVQLFLRTSRSVELTAAGRVFFAEACALLHQSELAAQAARRAAQPSHGALDIGFVGTTSYSFLPRLAKKMRVELPAVTVSFHEMTSVEQRDALSSRRIDLGLARPLPPQDGVHAACVMREGVALALPLDHPLAVKRRPQLSQLHGEPFIMYSKAGPYMRDMLNTAFRNANAQPAFVQFMSQAHAILSLVSVGLGVAIVPEETRNACFDNVVFRPIRLGPAVFVELHAMWRSDNRNPALLLLLERIPQI